jgi:hypothetical protein
MERLRLAGEGGGVLPRPPNAEELAELKATGYVGDK